MKVFSEVVFARIDRPTRLLSLVQTFCTFHADNCVATGKGKVSYFNTSTEPRFSSFHKLTSISKKSFGISWDIVHLSAKDWNHSSSKTLGNPILVRRITQRCRLLLTPLYVVWNESFPTQYGLFLPFLWACGVFHKRDTWLIWSAWICKQRRQQQQQQLNCKVFRTGKHVDACTRWYFLSCTGERKESLDQ